MRPSTPVFWPCTVPASGQKIRWVRRYSRSSSVMFSARRKVVAAAEMPVALAGQDGAADVAILPQVDPGLGNRVRRRLVEDIRLGRVVQGDVGDPVALLIVDGQLDILPLEQFPAWAGAPDVRPVEPRVHQRG